ncbi:IMP dehydrogenase, partial [Elusimicrobiota bacterium]
ESIVIDAPYSLSPSDTVHDARRMMQEREVGGLLVVDRRDKLLGVVTERDIRFVEDEDIPVRSVMARKLVTSRPGVSPEAARRLLQKHKIEKLPLTDKRGRLKGLITAKDILKRRLYPYASKDRKGRLLVGAAVGVVGDYLERAQSLHDAGADVLVVDVAHGHADHVIETIKRIKKTRPAAEVVAGNVATFEGARDLARAGADGVKVGVGPGAACSTRVIAGSGVPQMSAVLDCARITRAKGVPICADGGIKDSGDLTKALAAGASSVMIGSLFAGTDESPGWTVVRGGIKHKVYRGMASLGATLGRRQKETAAAPGNEDVSEVVPEGVESMVPYRGSIAEVVQQLVGGVRSGFSYTGAKDLKSFRRRAKFVRITAAGWAESVPQR